MTSQSKKGFMNELKTFLVKFLGVLSILGIVLMAVWHNGFSAKTQAQTTSTIYPHIPTANLMYRYSLPSSEADWTVRHYDLLVFDNNNYGYLDTLKSAAATAGTNPKMIWYQLWDTTGAGTTPQDLIDWCNAHGVNVESMFLHYSQDTSFALNGTNYSFPSYTNATNKSDSRARGYIWGGWRWIYNVGNPNFQQYRAEKVKVSVTSPPTGETSVFDGVFVDESIDRKVLQSCDSGVTSWSGGTIYENYPEYTGSFCGQLWNSTFPQTQWYKDWTTMAGSVRTYLNNQGLSAKITELNVGNTWWAGSAEAAAKGALRELWLVAGTWGPNSDTMMNVVKTASNNSVIQFIEAEKNSSFPTDTSRIQLWQLASFYLTKSAYTYFAPEYDPISSPTSDHNYGSYMPNKWFGAIEYNIGQPTTDYTTFATGTYGSGTPYKVLSRDFQNAKVLLRSMYHDSSGFTDNNFSDTSAVTINLSGTYYQLKVDGTVSTTPITSISLRNGEGAILVKPPSGNLTLFKSVDKTSVTPGGTDPYLNYSITYTNNTGAAIGPLTITDTVPAGTSFVSAGTGCSLVGSDVKCTISSVASGASGTVIFKVRAN